jgi:hypothetical protein
MMVQRISAPFLLGISMVLIAVSGSVVWLVWHYATDLELKVEIVKMLIQALLITGVGGVVIWILNHLNERRREQEQRLQDRISSMHVILSTISELYRSIKRTKRTLRSRSNWYKSEGDTIVLRQNEFVDLMDQIQDIQVRMEMLRDDVSARHTIFPAGLGKVLEKELNYIARYLHDVYEEYERAQVDFTNDQALIGKSCGNLRDFIYQRAMPQQLEDAVGAFTRAERAGDLSVAERRNYLQQLSEIRDELGRQRYAGVASALVYLAMSQIKEAAGTQARNRA